MERFNDKIKPPKRMNRKLFTLLSLILITTSAFTFTEDGNDFIEKLVAKFEKYHHENPQEKVYLHLDKPYYMAGETIWFKGYLFDATYHRIDSVSRVLYVDLIDESKGKIIIQRTLKCDGSTFGDIALPDSLEEGSYQIRAYTSYMRNFSEEFFFRQEVKIWQGTTQNRLTESNANKLSEVADFQFFPEGGNLVMGISSRVGFKAVNIAGKGVESEGFVLSSSKDTVTAFSSEHLGMGYFSFIPENLDTYTAYIKQKDGTLKPFPLPKVYEQGYTMAIDNLSNKEKIKVFISNSSPISAEKAKEVVIVAQQKGQICFVAKGSEKLKSFGITIPKDRIPDDGIVQITLFDSKGEPVCERIAFVNKNKQINLKISSDKAIYKSREKVTLNIEATDKEGKPVKGDFSVAVTDGNQVIPNAFQENLLTYLLLSSDIAEKKSNEYYSSIRGTIEQPAYYFESNNENATRHLDILMLTQGWRRFVWKDIIEDRKPNFQHILETGLNVTGKALRPNGKPANNVSLTLMLKSEKGSPQILMSNADSLGNYGFYGIDFNDSTEVFIQGMKEKGSKNLQVSIDAQKNAPKVQIIKTPFNPMEFDARELADFLKKAKDAVELEKKLKLNKVQMLDEVVVKAKKETQDSRKIYGRASNTLKVDDRLCAGATNVLQMLQGRVPGVQVSSDGSGGYKVVIRGISSISLSSDPLVVLDGMPASIDILTGINPCDVEQIDVLKGADATIFGSRASNGVISVLTKRGGPNYDYSKDPAMGVSIQKRLGYNVPREFYAPKYDVEKPEHVRPDFRSTLHWAPNVQTDSTGKATVTYWNTDAKANINIVAEGTAYNGGIGIAKHTYQVK